MFYKIKVDSSTKGKVFIPKELNETNKAINSISAGAKNIATEIVIDETLENHCIKISEDIINKLTIPEDISYGVNLTTTRKVIPPSSIGYGNCLNKQNTVGDPFEKMEVKSPSEVVNNSIVDDALKENTICLGPVIGLMVKTNSQKLTEENIESYVNYTLLYNQFHGILYVFAENDIDYETNTVKGYYFYEAEDGYGTMWKKAVLPIASAIYRRVGVDKDTRNKLTKLTNNRFFNSYYFDKLEFYDIVSSCVSLKQNIPETKKLKSLKDIDDMLSRHNSLFLKPVNGSRGVGQKKITRGDGSYIVKGKFDEIPLKFNSRGEIEAYIHKLAYNTPYLVQQGIDCVTFEDRCSAFRVIIQKNETLKWQCTTIIPCLGKKDGISSSYENYGYAMKFEEFFKKVLNYDSKKIFLAKMEIIEACKKVCYLMDGTGGNFGDVGIDVVIDKDLKIWVLEVNKRHQHEFPLYIKDYQSYYAIKNNPIKYAAALCGFYS